MKKLRLVLSDAAALDILEQANWYENQSGDELASRWEAAVTSSLFTILQSPIIGTPCRFKSEALADIKRTPVEGFPKHLIFYRIKPRELLVLRIVHGARDLEKLF